MANTKQRATDVDLRPAQSGSAYGNEAVHYGKIAPSAPDTSGILRVLRIPGGTRIDDLTVVNDDCDSTTVPALTCSVGYSPVDGSSPAANATYWFAAGQTFLQAAARSTSTSKPITFTKDVYVDIEIGAIAKSFIAGAEIHVIARGENVGV